MGKAEALLDLSKDRARINGKWVELVTAERSHYGMNVFPKTDNTRKFETLAAEGDRKGKDKDKEDKTEVAHKIRSTEKEYHNGNEGYFKRGNQGSNKLQVTIDNLKQGNRNKWSNAAIMVETDEGVNVEHSKEKVEESEVEGESAGNSEANVEASEE